MAPFPARRSGARPFARGATALARVALPTAMVVSTVAVASTGAQGCSNDDAVLAVDAAFDHPSIVVTPDVHVPFEATVDAVPLQTNVRVALMSDLGFGIDICVRSVGSSSVVTSPYVGPLLFEKLPSFPDAGSDAAKRVDADAARADGTLLDAREAGDASVLEAGAPDASTRDAEAGADAFDDGSSDAGDAVADGAREAAADARVDATTDAMTDGALEAQARVDAGERVGGVPAKQVSTYLSIQGSGTFDVAIVLGGASSCANAVQVQRVTLDAGKYTTLVVMGTLSSSKDGGADAPAPVDASRADATLLGDASKDGARDSAKDVGSDAMIADAGGPSVVWTLVALTDEPALSSTLAKARFFNATGSGGGAGALGALRVSAVGQSAPVPLASSVPFGRASLPNPANPAVDSLGYWEGAPVVSTVPISLRAGLASAAVDAAHDHDDGGAASPSWTFQSTSFDLVAATDHTGFLVGGGDDPVELVWCDDTTSPGASALTSCAVTTGP